MSLEVMAATGELWASKTGRCSKKDGKGQEPGIPLWRRMKLCYAESSEVVYLVNDIGTF